MTCKSCEHFRTWGCAVNRAGFPDVGTWCRAFCYLPGSDEAEDADA
jgi:hypothetical protein